MARKIDNLVGKLVLIDWIDSAAVLNGWKYLGGALRDKNLYDAPPIVSIGFVIKSTKKLVTLAPTFGNYSVTEELIIPRVAILRQTIMRQSASKKTKTTLRVVKKMIRAIAAESAT